MTNIQLQKWFNNLSFEERYEVQRFMIQLCEMEFNNDNN